MSEYELARQENIRANQLLLASLGIDPVQTKPAPTPKAEPDGKPKNRRPARSKPYERARAVPIRQSARISALDAPIYSDHLSIAASMDDKQGSIRRVYSDSPPAVRKAIRQLPRAPSPYVEDDVDYSIVAPQPARDDDGTFRFEAGYEGFTPNMAPWEMLREGSFDGSYWREFYSSVLRRTVPADYDSLPDEWYEGLDADQLLCSQTYRPEVNKYGVKASQSIEDWEKQGWIRPQDPRGWFQWYCRFFLGRRTADDVRQIGRWNGCAGPRGRFKTSLVRKAASHSQHDDAWDDPEIAPILRQTLQHWGVVLTREAFDAYLDPSA